MSGSSTAWPVYFRASFRAWLKRCAFEGGFTLANSASPRRTPAVDCSAEPPQTTTAKNSAAVVCRWVARSFAQPIFVTAGAGATHKPQLNPRRPLLRGECADVRNRDIGSTCTCMMIPFRGLPKVAIEMIY